MRVLRQKIFSGYQDSNLSGIGYVSNINVTNHLPPRTKKVIQGVDGTIRLIDLEPTEEDYIKAESWRGASDGLETGKKAGKILGYESQNFPVRLVTLLGAGIGAVKGAIKGRKKYRERKKKKDGNT